MTRDLADIIVVLYNMSSSSSRCDSDTDTDVESVSVKTAYTPHDYEPIAKEGEQQESGVEADQGGVYDGILPETLAARFEKTTPVNQWCSCGRCNDERLEGSLEFRCCREVPLAVGKLQFDGSIETLQCVTEHEDFQALVNKAVLEQVGPLLRRTNGRYYRRAAGQSENEYLRSVAYRWLVRWIFGFLGWENRRPLPACVYHQIRIKYPSPGLKGFSACSKSDE